MSNPKPTGPFDDFMADPDDGEDRVWPRAEPAQRTAPLVPDPAAQPKAEERLAPEVAVAGRPGSLQSFNRIRLLSCLLMVGLGLTGWRIHALDRERDTLALLLMQEVSAHGQTRLSARQTKLQLATVQRELVQARAAGQEQRTAGLAREAELLRLQKVSDTECATPRSILRAAGL
jgi:hypothetical protein